MKFKLTFKTPDVLEQLCFQYDGIDEEELDEFFSRFIRYRELIDVEFDTEKATAKVVRHD